MNNLSLKELEKIASFYQELLVPALFEVWSAQILDMFPINPRDKILDVACGTGVLARTAAKRLGHSRNVAGLDANLGMLSVAQKMNSGIEWQEGMAENLPWEDDFFNVVFSQFGLMLFEDKQKALQEMTRVLKKDGNLVVAVFDKLNNNLGYKNLIKIYDEVAGNEVAQALRAPFSMGNVDELRSLYKESGLPFPKITTYTVEANFPDEKTFVLADVKGWFPLAGITLDDSRVNEVIDKVKQDLDKLFTKDEQIRFPVSAHIIQLKKE